MLNTLKENYKDDPEFHIKIITYIIIGIGLKLIYSWSCILIFLICFSIYIITGGWRFLRVIHYTLGRDLNGLHFLIDIGIRMNICKRNKENIVTLFQKTVKQYPNKIALIMIDERSWTFTEVDEASNSVANYFYDQGFRKGDVIAIFMESRPEFIIVWLGLAKIGVVSALINFNLRREALAHCVSVSNARCLIYGSDFLEAITECNGLLPDGLKLYCKGAFNQPNPQCHLQFIHLDQVILNSSILPPPKKENILFHEKLLYIYTSGTTGLPKAAVVIHSRFFYMSHSIFFFFKMNSEDIIYDTLPLYHTAGGILGVGNCLIKGCTLVIRKKFSASRFWDDCIKHNCTAAQYIGEICRYLMAQPSKQCDSMHKVRLMYGNGLRPQIWKDFKQRFNIERLGEFYGATEGNANILNNDNTPGAIGFQTMIIPALYPVTLIRVDLFTGVPMRNKYGRCFRCKPGEPGELIGKIVKGRPMREFDGYANKDANQKKVAWDVFNMGDCYFLTGDILEMDEFGYMYFRDRTGDTYRWKGENVSTSEVEGIISKIIGLTDTTVFGVEIPGTEGKAGMLAVADPNNLLDLNRLNADIQKSLPLYARPIFIRVLTRLDITSTFKLKKTEYKIDGFNPDVISDFLYYYDNITDKYNILDKRAYTEIVEGNIRF